MLTNQTPSKVRRKLTPALSILYQPRDRQWSYSHHAAICKFQGRYYVMWSNGERDEMTLRQRVLFACSEDGVHWSAHRTLYPSQEGRVLTACGFHCYQGVLVAYAAATAMRRKTWRTAVTASSTISMNIRRCWPALQRTGNTGASPRTFICPLWPITARSACEAGGCCCPAHYISLHG